MPHQNYPKINKPKYLLFLSILIVTIFFSSIAQAQDKDNKVYTLFQ